MKFSRLQLGSVQFGMDYGIANTGGKPSYETARDIIKAAWEGGVNCLDTAAAYGDSELVLGRALAELKLKDKMRVISKVPGVGKQNFSAAAAERFIVESVEKSLARLGVDSLSVCLFHVEEDIKYIDVLKNLERQGLIGGAGVSLDSNQYCETALAADINYVQLPYNILDKRFDAFFAAAHEREMKLFARSAYLQGLLLMPEANIAEELREVIPVRRKLAELAAAARMEMPELCIRYVLSNPAITSVLTGVDNIEQLKQNLELLEKGPLPDDLYGHVLAATPPLPERLIRPARWPVNQ